MRCGPPLATPRCPASSCTLCTYQVSWQGLGKGVISSVLAMQPGPAPVLALPGCSHACSGACSIPHCSACRTFLAQRPPPPRLPSSAMTAAHRVASSLCCLHRRRPAARAAGCQGGRPAPERGDLPTLPQLCSRGRAQGGHPVRIIPGFQRSNALGVHCCRKTACRCMPSLLWCLGSNSDSPANRQAGRQAGWQSCGGWQGARVHWLSSQPPCFCRLQTLWLLTWRDPAQQVQVCAASARGREPCAAAGGAGRGHHRQHGHRPLALG